MCGRYHVDEETAKQIEKIIHLTDENVRKRASINFQMQVSESVLERKSFREGMEHRRIVIPAAWFYEWNRNKEKNIFYRKGEPVLFMAGIYNHYEAGDCFTILTTQANASVKPIHDRMPLVLEENDIIPWIFDRQKAVEFLRKVPCLLDRKAEYEQMSLL